MSLDFKLDIFQDTLKSAGVVKIKKSNLRGKQLFFIIKAEKVKKTCEEKICSLKKATFVNKSQRKHFESQHLISR